MASKAPTPEDQMRTVQLLREAEEALAQERLQNFWRENGKTIIGMAIMLVIGTAAGSAWRAWRAHENAQSTAILLSATSPTQQAQTTPEQFAKSRAALTKGQNALGALIDASLQMDKHGKDKAAKQTALQSVFGASVDKLPSDPWEWLNAWAGVRLQLDDTTKDAKALESKLIQLAGAQKGNPLAALAYIDAAVLVGERNHDAAGALTHLKAAQDAAGDGTSLNGLIEELTHIYTVVAEEKK